MTEPKPEDERVAARREGQHEEWDKKVLEEIMASAHGRYWMERLLDRCGTNQELYLNDGDVYAALKRDGRADIGRYLEGQLQDHTPDLFLRMIRERRARIQRVVDKNEREERRRIGPGEVDVEETVAVGVEELADQQRRESEAAMIEPKPPGEKLGTNPRSGKPKQR